jgi:hypothetical protein
MLFAESVSECHKHQFLLSAILSPLFCRFTRTNEGQIQNKPKNSLRVGTKSECWQNFYCSARKYGKNKLFEAFSKASHWYADGTFNTAAKHYYQLYIIHAYVNNHMVPCCFGLMKRIIFITVAEWRFC